MNSRQSSLSTPRTVAVAKCFTDLPKNKFFRRKIRTFTKSRDTDKDGYITRKDVDTILERSKDRGIGQQHMTIVEEFMYKNCDEIGLVDDSKAITYQEFEAGYFENMEYTYHAIPHFFKAVFASIDEDTDGIIGLKEWEDHCCTFGIDMEYCPDSFRAMDRDKDGKVSMDEFLAFHMEFFYTAEDTLNSSVLFGPLEKLS